MDYTVKYCFDTENIKKFALIIHFEIYDDRKPEKLVRIIVVVSSVSRAAAYGSAKYQQVQ